MGPAQLNCAAWRRFGLPDPDIPPARVPALRPRPSRDDNSGMGTRYPLGTRPDGYGDDFLSAGGTCT
jgi:hypothetical protein